MRFRKTAHLPLPEANILPWNAAFLMERGKEKQKGETVKISLPPSPLPSKICSLLTLKEGLIFSLLMNKFRFQGQAGPTPLIHRYCKEDLQLDEAKLITAQYM